MLVKHFEGRVEITVRLPLSQVGLDKLSSTKDVVATLQEELTVLQPQLVKTMKEVQNQSRRWTTRTIIET